MNWFDIKFDKLILLLLPLKLRKRLVFSYLKTAFAPIKRIYGTWKEQRLKNNYRATMTGQVWSIKKVLNDYLKIKTVEVVDGVDARNIFISNKRPVYTKFFASNNDDVNETFVVKLPKDKYENHKDEVKALVDML